MNLSNSVSGALMFDANGYDDSDGVCSGPRGKTSSSQRYCPLRPPSRSRGEVLLLPRHGGVSIPPAKVAVDTLSAGLDVYHLVSLSLLDLAAVAFCAVNRNDCGCPRHDKATGRRCCKSQTAINEFQCSLVCTMSQLVLTYAQGEFVHCTARWHAVVLPASATRILNAGCNSRANEGQCSLGFH